MNLAPRYELTFGRVIIAWCAGAITGGFLTGMVEFVMRMAKDWPSISGAVLLDSMRRGVEFSLMAMPLWAMFLLVLGALPWFALHQAGLRQWNVAVATGFLVPIAFLMFISGGSWDSKFYAVVPFFAAVGAIVAFVVWRVAYRLVDVPIKP